MGELASQGENNKDLTPSAGLPWLKRHDVQFYDDDQQLATSIGRYLAEGIRFAQPAIVIATPQHRRAFAAVMRTLGVDVEGLHDSQLVWLDARETLSAFMQGHRPDAELFEATVGNVFEKLIGTRHYVTVRAYGEMVDVLWRDGKQDAAIELEKLWNDLASKYSFSLLCAYDKHCVADTADMARIAHVHTSVITASAD
jgi:hypothetical protein